MVRERLVSRGGRPSDPAWTISRKVPMRPETWDELDRLARNLREQSIRVSAGQVAAIALERGLPKSSGESTQLLTRSDSTVTIHYRFSREVQMRALQSYRALSKHPFWSCES
jgi:hypothetical protein